MGRWNFEELTQMRTVSKESQPASHGRRRQARNSQLAEVGEEEALRRSLTLEGRHGSAVRARTGEEAGESATHRMTTRPRGENTRENTGSENLCEGEDEESPTAPRICERPRPPTLSHANRRRGHLPGKHFAKFFVVLGGLFVVCLLCWTVNGSANPVFSGSC